MSMFKSILVLLVSIFVFSSCGYERVDAGYEGIKVNEMIIIKPSLIDKIIKRKIKKHLDFYLKVIIDNIDNDSDDDTRIALDDLARYKKIIKERYSIYLDKKYMELLNKKISVIERELQNNLICEKSYDEEVKKR